MSRDEHFDHIVSGGLATGATAKRFMRYAQENFEKHKHEIAIRCDRCGFSLYPFRHRDAVVKALELYHRLTCSGRLLLQELRKISRRSRRARIHRQ